jgi:hypothetical protein
MGTEKFRLTKVLTGITFTNGGKGQLVALPIGAMLHPSGETSLPGFIEVTYGREHYSVFERDLQVGAERYRSTAPAAWS